MAGGFRTPQDDIGILMGRLSDLAAQVRELARPSGTQTADAVKTLMQLVNDLPGQIYAVLATAVNTGTVNATGNVVVGGDVTASGKVTSAQPVVSPGSRAYNVVPAGGYAGAWLDVNGKLGINPSGVEFKQDFEPANTSEIVDALLHFGLLRYRFIAEVEERGDDAPYYLGSIAQYMAAGPLVEWVSETPAGAVINWEHAAIPLVATVQSIDARLRAAGL